MRRQEPFAHFGVTKASQLVTKSDQWFSDVQLLYRNGRYAAALYLGGFVIECLLKAALWNRRFEGRIRSILYGSHDLERLLGLNAELRQAYLAAPARLRESFSELSAWTVRVRYNPRRPSAADAEAFVGRLREVRAWLRQRA
jgi:HEPN domain-containing protein